VIHLAAVVGGIGAKRTLWGDGSPTCEFGVRRWLV
jgi:hypothetical protein